MAVLVEGISVIVRRDSIARCLPGEWTEFEKLVPNATLCTDDELARVGFMHPRDVESFVTLIEGLGLRYVENDEAVDIAVVCAQTGPAVHCEWLEFYCAQLDTPQQVVLAARLIGGTQELLATPDDWTWEGSLTAKGTFVLTEEMPNQLRFLRHEGSLDVYLDLTTGQEVFVGRPS